MVEAAITEVLYLTAVLSKLPKSMLLPDTVPQFVPVIEVPVQKTKDSSITPVKLIWVAVEAATTPLSIPVVHESSEYVFILAKNVVLVVVGF